jgi:hypothetical protein
MSPLASWLLLVAAVIPAVWLVLRFDSYLWRRKYERDDETRQYAKAREAVARQQANGRTRIGHKDTRKDTP